jgi:hypothetical protein
VIFRYLYKRKLLRGDDDVPRADGVGLVDGFVSSLTEWQAFVSLLPRFTSEERKREILRDIVRECERLSRERDSDARKP